MRTCVFNVNGVCYSMECKNDLMCDCKNSDGKVVRVASVRDIHEINPVMPKVTVMQPTVENVSMERDGIPDLDCGIYDTEQSVILPKLK